jgi:hypothetical protein
VTSMKLGTLMVIAVAVLAQITFCVVVIRNVVMHKSLVGWLFPGGTTKTEKIILILSLSIVFIIIIFGPFSSE